MSTVRSLDVAVRANTQNFEGGMRRVSQGLRAAVQGLNAVTAAAAAQEKNFLQIANSLAIGFASGGPWGLAIAGAGVGLGLLIGHYKKLREESDKAAESQKRFAESMREIERGSLALGEQIDFIRAAGREGSPEEIRLQTIQGRRGRQSELLEELETRLSTEGGEAQRDPTIKAMQRIRQSIERIDAEAELLQEAIALQAEKGSLLSDIDAKAKAAEDAAKRLRAEMERVPMAVGVAADAVFALLDGIIIRGAKASEVVRSVLQGIASIGLRAGVNAAFGIATP